MTDGPSRDRVSPLRRGLARVVAVLHYALIPYTLLAGLLPHPRWLEVHIVLVPLIVAHWFLNRGVCVLNNLVTLLLRGRWWDPDDPDQGHWVERVTRSVLGQRCPRSVIVLIPYVTLALAWLTSILHWLRLDAT